MESNIFFLDLNFLDKKGDDKLKKFAKDEELDEKDIIKIIYNEANRIGIKDKVKVTFKIVDPKEGSFRVIVEPSYVKYKGVVIYPFDTIKSQDFELPLDIVCGKVTLYNKKDVLKNISVTIDYVALDLFAMTYKKAKDFLINISDRKGKNGYIDLKDSICFKQYGIKLNAKKDKNGNVLENSLVNSIDVYNEEEFFKEFHFKEEQKQEEKYDVNIPMSIDIESSVKESDSDKKEKSATSIAIDNNPDIEIEIPIEETKKVNDVKTNDIKNDVKEDKKEEIKKENVNVDAKAKEELNLTNQQVEVVKDKDKEDIKELEKLFEEERKQQQILEERIKAKLEELKSKIQQKEEKVIETVSVMEPENYKAYEIESYKGIKEKGKSDLCVFFGQSKNDVRKYFGGMPKEIREYEEMEIYDIFYAYYDEDDTCTGIGIYNQDFYKDKVALYFENENLITMTYSQIVSLLKKYDYNTIEDEDGIISLKYGISVDPQECDDFQNKICEVIHIFKKGYYDAVYENV